MQKDNLKSGVINGVLISILIGVVIIIITRPAFGSSVLILSLATLPGFFITSLLYTYKLSKEKVSRDVQEKKFDWDVEINLRKLEIIYVKYSAMMQSVGLLAAAALIGMVFLGKDFPAWGTGHLILFPLTTVIFIACLHLMFRWWFAMRSNVQHLQFRKGRNL